MECDSVHAAVETARRKVPIYSPDGYYTLVRVARKNNPYTVHELGHKDFLDFKSFSNHVLKNKTKDEEGQAVHWQKIKWFCYTKEEPRTIFFKYDFTDPTFRELKVAKQATRGARSTHSMSKPSSMYESPPGISALKKKDLLTLCGNGSIPHRYIEFYNALTVDNVFGALQFRMSHTNETISEQATEGGVTEQKSAHETRSQYSNSSSSSKSSSVSRAAAKARAKVEAARARAAFVQREADLRLEEAHLAADLKIREARLAAELSALKHQKEVAAALAKAEVLEAAAENLSKEGSRSRHDTVRVAIQRTRDYVERHAQPHPSDAEPPVLSPYTPSLSPYTKPDEQSQAQEHGSTRDGIKPDVKADKEKPGLNSGASPFVPKDNVHAAQPPGLATPAVPQHARRDNDNHKAQQPGRPTPAVHDPLSQLPSAQAHSPSFNRASLQPNTDDRSVVVCE
ncbi:hypothetical protein ABVT39_018645 [Epinephelus coioides]